MTRRGFTVLEVVVALSIAGLAVAAGYSALGLVIDRRAATTRAMDSTLAVTGVRRAIEAWLAGARLETDALAAAFQGRDGNDGELADDDLRFVTTARTPLESGDAWVHLWIDRDDGTAETGLVASFSRSRNADEMRQVLVPDAQGLDVRYQSQVIGAGTWLPSWTSSTLLPAGIELRLSAATGHALPALLEFPILAVVGVGR